MTRNVLVFALIVLPAVLPLAAVPLETIVVVEAPLVVANVVPFVSADVQPVALLALAFFRAPPSR